MDAEKEIFELVYSSHDSIYFGEGLGGLNIWGEGVGKCSTQRNLHERVINYMDFNSENYNIMATSTSSSEGTACIWDLRSINVDQPKTLKEVSHIIGLCSLLNSHPPEAPLQRQEQYGVGMIHTFSSAIGREELMLSPQLRREQYSLARVCQRFQAGLMHTLTKLACLQEPHVGAMFIYGN